MQVFLKVLHLYLLKKSLLSNLANFRQKHKKPNRHVRNDFILSILHIDTDFIAKFTAGHALKFRVHRAENFNYLLKIPIIAN